MSTTDLTTMNDDNVEQVFAFFLKERQKIGRFDVQVDLDPEADGDETDILREILLAYTKQDPELMERYKAALVARREPHPDCGDLMSKEEFIESVDRGEFIDYDGWGNVADEKVYDPCVAVRPSAIIFNEFQWPEWVTHIIWYNR